MQSKRVTWTRWRSSSSRNKQDDGPPLWYPPAPLRISKVSVDAEAGGTPERHCGRLIPIPALAIIGLLIVFPLAFNLYMSLQTWFVSSATSPQFVGVRNFIEILGMDVRFWNSIWITVKFAAIGVWLDLILGLGIALYVQRDFPGKGTFRTVMLLPMVSTPVAVALIWVIMFNPSL